MPESIREKCDRLQQACIFSERVLKVLETQMASLPNKYENYEVTIVIAGSVSRKEAHETSDVDAFLVFDSSITEREEEITEHLLKSLEQIVRGSDIGLRMASPGAFSNSCSVEWLMSNVGGRKETNDLLTRRMLLMTEGSAICNPSLFRSVKKSLIMRYLADLQPANDRRPVFLLNDLIRYYRTICVDYEYKKNEVGKPWAVRLTKLRHSRKLLYFSVLLPLIESMHVDQERRIEWLLEQFTDYTPLERIIHLLSEYGQIKHWEILHYYDTFLGFMTRNDRRAALDDIQFEGRQDHTEYVLMRDNARSFRKTLNDFVRSVEHWQEPLEKYVLS